MTQKHLIIFKI